MTVIIIITAIITESGFTITAIITGEDSDMSAPKRVELKARHQRFEKAKCLEVQRRERAEADARRKDKANS